MLPLLLMAMVYDTLKRLSEHNRDCYCVCFCIPSALPAFFLRFTIGVRQITNGNHELPIQRTDRNIELIVKIEPRILCIPHLIMVFIGKFPPSTPTSSCCFDWPPISTKTIHIRVIAFLHHVSFYLIQIVKRCVMTSFTTCSLT